MNGARSGGKARFSVYSSKCVNSHSRMSLTVKPTCWTYYWCIRKFSRGFKIRPKSQPRISLSNQRGNGDESQKGGEDSEWQRTVSPMRPHTVAVMSRDSTRPTSTNDHSSCNSTKKIGTNKVLCGCASRQPMSPPDLENLAETNLPLVTPHSPLNDVTDLLFGIQSVQITVKPQNTD